MESVEIKFFKLDYSGNFEEISTDSPLDLFTLFDILEIYIPNQKRMYIWIGKKTTQSLKNYIAQIRQMVSEKLSGLTILRYITIESGSEPSEFFQFVNFTQGELNSHIEKLEAKYNPIIENIEELKERIVDLVNSEEFENAIKSSEEIIKLSIEIKDDALKREQEAKIEDFRERAENKEILDKIKENTDVIKKSFEELRRTFKPKDIIEAHKIVEDFKRKYENDYDLSTVPLARELITEEERVWQNFTADQDYASKELNRLVNEISRHMEENELSEAEEILGRAKDLLLVVTDDDLKNKWIEIESEFQKVNKWNEIESEYQKSIEESSELTKIQEFEKAISRIDSALEIIQKKNILDYTAKLSEKKSEILTARNEYVLQNERIVELENLINKNRENGHLNAAILNCEKIIRISGLIKKQDIVEKYTLILEEIKSELANIKAEVKNKRAEFINKARELENVLEFEEDVLPLIEEFSVIDILGDLSDDINEKSKRIGALLNDHRVEIKEEISNKALLISVSGEIVELKQEFQVQKKEGEDQILKFNVLSEIVNPFDDVIEKAIITDLIPYNFEILEVQLDGKPVDALPDKSPTKEGIEINWEIYNVPPKEKIEINYELRRRVSRTIIFIIKNQLRIIKTHSKLSMLELEGLYEATLPFTNSFGEVIEGVIVEDIIPLYYLHFIKQPVNILPAEITSSKLGELIKWNIGNMEPQTLNYQYRLLELYRFEEIKINISELSKNGIESLDKGDLTNTLDIYEKIINQLEEYNK